MGRNTSENISHGTFLFYENKKVTPLGILVLLDMVQNPDIWEEFKIDFYSQKQSYSQMYNSKNLAPFKHYLTLINLLAFSIKNDEPLIKVLKCLCYLGNLEVKNNKEEFFTKIDTNKDYILNNLKFKKISKKDLTPDFVQNFVKSNFKGSVDANNFLNLLVLEYKDEILHDKKLQQLIDEIFKLPLTIKLNKTI